MIVTIRRALPAAFALVLGVAGGTALAQQGPGMMGAGPGMMGHGPGMMGYGPGMMGGGRPSAFLNLSEEQRARIESIREETRQKNWAAMGQMHTEMFKLRRLYGSDKMDANAVIEQQKKVDEIRLQLLKSHLEGQNQIEAVLTPEQRKEFRHFRPWWMHGGEQ